MSTSPVAPRSGRPRSTAVDAHSTATTREELLQAAAALFAEGGYAATTTRAIAERVGIRQASLYYHFAGKDELLLELLEDSVGPTLQYLPRLSGADDPAAALYALAAIDVGTLLASRYNIGALYLSPEVQGEQFASFRNRRAQLGDAYQRLAQGAQPDQDATFLGACCMQLVELVINIRRLGEPAPGLTHSIAAACLRLVDRTPAEGAGRTLLHEVLTR